MTTYNQTILKKDANGNVIQDSYYSDMAFRGDADGGANLIYKGFARPGASESADVWQIAKMAYDANNNITSITWPQGSNSAASSEFIFAWSDRASYTYS